MKIRIIECGISARGIPKVTAEFTAGLFSKKTWQDTYYWTDRNYHTFWSNAQGVGPPGTAWSELENAFIVYESEQD